MTMYREKRILGVITARGGSKGIPRKNIKILSGKPLISYTIEAAQKSKYLTRTIVSTDDETIAQTARQCGGEVPFLRPASLAEDTSTSLPVVQHALNWIKEQQHEEYDYVLILQPTSPLRTATDIDACITKIIDTQADSVMSMVELSDFSLKKLKKIEADLILPLAEEEGSASALRQEGIKVYKRNCAIYLTKVALVLAGDLFGKISRPYIMPPERSVDINTLFDWELAEFFLKKTV